MAPVSLATFQLSCNHIRRINTDARVEEGDKVPCYECPAIRLGSGPYPPQRTVQLRLE